MKFIVPYFFIACIFTLSAQENKIKPYHTHFSDFDTLPRLPDLKPIPEIPVTEKPGTIEMLDPKNFQEAKMDFPIAEGPVEPTWESINANAMGCADWLRDAKFGIWVHFGPQASGKSGDWYARRMYLQGQTAYNNHLKDFGHPSVAGYKDILHQWNPCKLNPKYLAKLYYEAGARFLFIQGVHHDNFDLWNSRFQPWNSVNMGPKRDLLAEWAHAARSWNMKFGVTFHHEYTWWWWESAFRADTAGDKTGIPYDGNLSLTDGKGKWWEGYDPRMLYGINLREYRGVDQFKWTPPRGIFGRHLEYAHWYANNWALRILDVIGKYDPDFIYTDGNDTQPFSGTKTGTGYKCDASQRVIASYYNRAIVKHGKIDVFSIVKFHPAGNKGIVTTFEGSYPKDIKTDQYWIGENAVGDWYWTPGIIYSANAVIHFLLECVSRDGSYAVNIPVMPDGSLEPECLVMLKDIGKWMRINGEGIYGSKAWLKYGEGRDGIVRNLPKGQLGEKQASFKFETTDFRFTKGKNDCIYAFCLTVPGSGETVSITSFGLKNSFTPVKIKSVELLGYNEKLSWIQDSDALQITFPEKTKFKYSVCFKIAME